MSELIKECVFELLETMVEDLTEKATYKEEQNDLVALKTSVFKREGEEMFALWCIVLTPDRDVRDAWTESMRGNQGEWEQYHFSHIPGLDIPKE